MDIAELQHEVAAFAHARHWQTFHDPKNLAMALASEVGELNAILRWVPSNGSDVKVAQTETRDRVTREIGDVAILLLLLCERSNIDLAAAVRSKLKINEVNYPLGDSPSSPERPTTS